MVPPCSFLFLWPLVFYLRHFLFCFVGCRTGTNIELGIASKSLWFWAVPSSGSDNSFIIVSFVLSDLGLDLNQNVELFEVSDLCSIPALTPPFPRSLSMVGHFPFHFVSHVLGVSPLPWVFLCCYGGPGTRTRTESWNFQKFQVRVLFRSRFRVSCYFAFVPFVLSWCIFSPLFFSFLSFFYLFRVSSEVGSERHLKPKTCKSFWFGFGSGPSSAWFVSLFSSGSNHLVRCWVFCWHRYHFAGVESRWRYERLAFHLYLVPIPTSVLVLISSWFRPR